MGKGKHEKSVRIVNIQAMTRTWLIPNKVLKPNFQVWFWRRLGFIDNSYVGLSDAGLYN
jgi:hypothetical protein